MSLSEAKVVVDSLHRKLPTVVVVGSTMMDMITYIDTVPESGETLIGDSFALGFGGKGANQSVMAARMGANVYMVNTLGDDVFGDSTLKNFQDQGINTTFVARTAGASGVAPIWVEKDGSNRIICVPGSNNAMTPAQATHAIESIKDIDIVIGQLEIPQEVTAAAFRAAQARGIITILNPAPFAPLSAELLAASDWVAPNEHEFAAMHPRNLSPNSDETIRDLAKLLGKRILVTLGELGAVFTTKSGEITRIPSPKVQAIDTTGAGDSFVGSFAFGLASGMSEELAVKLGCACASKSVTRRGTQSSYSSKEEAQEIIKGITN
ncbi:MAG: ribokinase [Actinobacteria bacterium]|nr:ribokinase [Actinomycetota bacterium]